MHHTTLLLLLVVAVAGVVFADSNVNQVYKAAKKSLDPNNELALDELDYELKALYKCKPYNCGTEGPSDLTQLSDAELRWYTTMKSAVVSLRKVYPKHVGKV